VTAPSGAVKTAEIRNLTPNPFPRGKGNRIVESSLFARGKGDRIVGKGWMLARATSERALNSEKSEKNG
jgi:hypothetical protein